VKGTLPAGKTYDAPIIYLGAFPPVVAAAGGSVEGGKTLDGVDLVPCLAGKATGRPHPPRRARRRLRRREGSARG
jgi:hypothetical protein